MLDRMKDMVYKHAIPEWVWLNAIYAGTWAWSAPEVTASDESSIASMSCSCMLRRHCSLVWKFTLSLNISSWSPPYIWLLQALLDAEQWLLWAARWVMEALRVLDVICELSIVYFEFECTLCLQIINIQWLCRSSWDNPALHLVMSSRMRCSYGWVG